ncbi:type II toxin-antitoxin system PemK/MazF family toxin [Clostridioides difficile]|uniref:type II toxin-antitoxin system PemK/MazF family toxin n=1 Tax=Clostridioides difficile TaxID=1496 RepID=UPI000428DD8C|nr:type II toxin-antitoxin system PemK/MazF family toxin [Clostridioides difficile]
MKGRLPKGSTNCEIKRGDLYYADLSPVVGSEQGGVRPVLIIQNDVGNKYSPTVIVSAITSQINKAKLPTHVEISSNEYGLNKDSVILLEQIRTIDKKRLREKIGCLDENMMIKVDDGLQISLGLFTF